LDGNLVIHDLSHGGEGQNTLLQLQVLELRLLLVRPAHGPGELVPVLLDRQGGRSLLAADLILALPRPDRVYDLAVRCAHQATDREDQSYWENYLHHSLREVT